MDTLRISTQWRRENGCQGRGGVVVLFDDEVQGWCNQLPIRITGDLAVLPLMRPVSTGKRSAAMSYLVLKTGEGLKIERITEQMKIPYIAKLIGPSGVVQVLEFWASDDEEAWHIAHENVDPLRGGWVEVKPMPDTQESMDLTIENEQK